MKAAGKNQRYQTRLQQVNTQKVMYGKAETRQSITNVLDAVLDTYKYTSLNQLNAVLQLYNVRAEQGDHEGRIFKNQGLIYRILNEKGVAVGVPVKASSIYSKPTVKNLEAKFAANKFKRQPHEKRLKAIIDWALTKRPAGLQNFITALEKERVNTVVRKNEQGFIYGLTFIDHQTKSVFNGSDLGKAYSAKIVLERCGQPQKQLPTLTARNNNIEPKNELKFPENRLAPHSVRTLEFLNLIEGIIHPDEQHGQAVSLQPRRKRKKRRRLSTH